MNKTIMTIAALAALGLAAGGCAKDSKDMAATDAKAAPAEAAAADTSAAPADKAADTAAAPADKPADASAAADQGSATVPEAAPAEGAPAADTAAAAPETPPQPQDERQMLRDVRMGARALHTCVKIDDETVDTFQQCVNDAMSNAESKGGVTDSFHLGVDYRAWAFLGEHAETLKDKGMEWSKGYRKAYATRETYRQSAENLLGTTGLSESKVCSAIDVSDCPK
jgi:hypothetical protein